jgi:hypothetical protein
MKSLTCALPALFLLIPSLSLAQDKICEKLGGQRIVADFVCPLGYLEVGEVEASSSSGRSRSAGMQIYQDMINRNEADRQARLNRQAAAAEAQRQREYEAQQSAGRQQQQNMRNSKLVESARCLEGGWEIRMLVANSETTPVRLDVTNDGMLFVDGQQASFQPNTNVLLANNAISFDVRESLSSSTTRLIQIQLSLKNGKLIGSMKSTTKKEKFFGGTNDSTETYEAIGVRASDAPMGCTANLQRDSSAERGETIADGLKNLSDLYSQGILTEEEFNAAKRRLLGL